MNRFQRQFVCRWARSGRKAVAVILSLGAAVLATHEARADVQRLPSAPYPMANSEPAVANPMYPPVLDDTPQVQPVVIAPGPYWDSAAGPWRWQLLPEGVIYHSYLAGVKEPRFASQWVHDSDTERWLWDIALGGRVGILRYGTQGPYQPEGWELDIEGAAFPQLDINHARDLNSVDFRFGIPLTWGRDWYQAKLAYYHLSSHLGDELMIRDSSIDRINYVRDALVWGNSVYLYEDLRLYAEAAWAFHIDGGAKPWEFQFGVEYSPAAPTGLRGAPFWAVNGQLREELDYAGNVVVQAGWQWRGVSSRLMRVGMQYYAGYSDQYEFFDQYVDKLGFGVWYDF